MRLAPIGVSLAIILAACAPSLIAPGAAARVSEREEHFMTAGREVAVDHYTPGTTGRHPAVLLLHGSGGLHLFFGKEIQAYAQSMAAGGLEAFVVHYFDATDTFLADDDEERAKYDEWVRATSDAITYVAAQPDVRVPQISVLGISLGAYLAVGVAATDPRVAATVIVAGGLEPFLRDRIKRLPPTLILHGDKDGTVAVSEGLEL